MNLNELKEIGLTEGEIKVYEALLKLGECTKTILAKESKISPSNIYDITNRLIKKGVISKVEKNGVSHFSPANPKRLLDFLKQKKEEITKEEEIVNSLLPQLISIYDKENTNVKVEVFYGWNGLKTMFEDLLDECGNGDKCAVFGASAGANSEQTDSFFLKYSKARADRGIKTEIIFNEEVKKRKDRIKYFLHSKNYTVKFLHQSTPTEIMIYKNKVCIIILTKDPLVIRITGEESANSFLQYFKELWKTAEK
jgi:sugar-specific transcriptional regulator TrmB